MTTSPPPRHGEASGPLRKPTAADLRAVYLRGETAWAVLLVLASLEIFRRALGLELMQAHDPLGARFFPILMPLLLLGSTLAVLVSPLARLVLWGPERPPPPQAAQEPVHAEVGGGALGRPLPRVIVMIGVCVGYVLLLHLLGYMPATVLAIIGVLYVLGARTLRTYVVAPVVVTLVVFFVFSGLLNVRLP